MKKSSLNGAEDSVDNDATLAKLASSAMLDLCAKCTHHDGAR